MSLFKHMSQSLQMPDVKNNAGCCPSQLIASQYLMQISALCFYPSNISYTKHAMFA